MDKETKNCQNCKREFLIDRKDFDFYAKIKVPAPTWCPDCRMVRRMIWWNERHFFKRQNQDGKTALSTYPEESYFKTIDKETWWSDKFEAKDYGRDYDFSRTFFEQLKELSADVPFPDKSGTDMLNSEYSNVSNGLKNCYMCFNDTDCQDCLYTVFSSDVKDSVDVFTTGNAESCYELYTTGDNYRLFFGVRSRGSRESYFLSHAFNCSNCFACINLRNKEYHIFNEPYSQADYLKKLAEFDLGSHSSLQEIKSRFDSFKLKFPYEYMSGARNSGEISGDTIFGSKNIQDSYALYDSENVRYSQSLAFATKDSYDFTNWGVKSELVYEAVECGDSIRNIKFSYGCATNSQNLEYCLNCFSSEDCFGCVGLKKAKYCIFNKQYSKEEYFELKEKIVAQMDTAPYIDKLGRIYRYGEFFPIDMAPFAANETAITDWIDLSKEKALEYGLIWREPKPNEYKITIGSAKLPDHIKNTGDEVLKEIIGCEACGLGYRIVPKELDFYRRFGLPLPRFCIDCRFKKRVSQRNLPRLYESKCQCGGSASQNKVYKNLAEHFHGTESCPNKFKTPYRPEDPRIIYCKDCYNREIF